MNREARGVILAVMAVLLLRLSLTDDYLLYVKSSMRPFLIVSGVLLAGLAIVDLLGWLSRSDDAHDHDHHHDHGDQPAHVGHGDEFAAHEADDHAGHRHGLLPWILLAPFLVVFSIGPSPLGAYMAARQSTSTRVDAEAVTPGDSDTSTSDDIAYPPLPPAIDGAVELGLTDFVNRVAYDEQRQMEGELIRLDGFVTPDETGPGDTVLLTRFTLSCCAADGIPVSVRMVGLDPLPEADTWLEVEGYWVPHTGDQLPVFDDFAVETVTEIPAPTDPYL